MPMQSNVYTFLPFLTSVLGGSSKPKLVSIALVKKTTIRICWTNATETLASQDSVAHHKVTDGP